MKNIFFTVTNDLTYDQRMQRICTTLVENGYAVTLIGRKRAASLPLRARSFRQKRLRCWFTKGKFFYAEYNLRLLFWLLFQKIDAICAIDLDTIVPCYHISKWKKIPRIYDAHELFTELKEVISRPGVKRVWTGIEKKYVPRYPSGYTVSESIAVVFNERYGVKYDTIRNMPILKNDDPLPIQKKDRFILYQGAVNEARGFEFLVPAMQKVEARLVICGDGNFMPQLKQLISNYHLEQKIELSGMLEPANLEAISREATIGLTLAEKEGLNQYLALPNKFFDYIHAGIPQIAMNFPEYRAINEQYEVAVLIENLEPERIAAAINNLLADVVLLDKLAANCLKARKMLNWQMEEKKLLAFYQTILR